MNSSAGLLPYEDVVQGIFRDTENRVCILFTRSCDHPISSAFRTMVQTSDGEVLAVDKMRLKGFFVFKVIILTLSDVTGESVEVTPRGIRDAYDNSAAKAIMAADVADKLFPSRGQYTPDNFWCPLSEAKKDEAFKLSKT